MTDYVTLKIPREVLRSARMTEQQLRTELAVSLFQQNRLSFGKAREIAGMYFWAFQQLLGGRGISVHYDKDDFEADLKTLSQLGE